MHPKARTDLQPVGPAGERLSDTEWAARFVDPAQRWSTITVLEDGSIVTTLWFGIPSGAGGETFESTHMRGDGPVRLLARYSNRDAAEAGHVRWVAVLSGALTSKGAQGLFE